MPRLTWNSGSTDRSLHELLRTLAEEYPIAETDGPPSLVFERAADPERLKVTVRGKQTVVEYGRTSIAARGAAYALANRECDEKIIFDTFGILFDCTRGNVLTVDHFKRWLRRLALMGYNTAMIYVKDAYQLPDEPYWGYMRGAYSVEEIQEIDRYARKLQIEMIASIQTLGHVEPALRWPAYAKVRDTADVLLVDEEATYQLLDKMLSFWSKALSSRRIHLGMDETHSLGRGKFLDRHGYEKPFDIYVRHLKRVCGMCKKYDFRPIIWHDMFFKYLDFHAPDLDTGMVPREVQVAYWNYYSRDKLSYAQNFPFTQFTGQKLFIASGIWTWLRLWTDYELSFATAGPCIDACREAGAKEFILTLWGDDGAYCDFDSALAGLAWAADRSFNGTADEKRISALYRAVCKTSYELQIACGGLCYTFEDAQGEIRKIPANALLWDDPLMGIVWNELPFFGEDIPAQLIERYRQIKERVEPFRNDMEAGSYDYAWHIADVLIRKIEIRGKLVTAYAARDGKALAAIARKEIPEVLEAIDGLLQAFRTQWRRSFKSFGTELMQIRLGGLKERYKETAAVIEELLAGRIEHIGELEVKHEPSGYIPNKYALIATGGFFI